jgi:large subunit ribosomal protein L22
MDIKANAKYIRMSPKKVRLVAGLIRGLDVKRALDQLAFSGKKAALPVVKLIKSAVANAEHNYELAKDNLFVKEIRIDEAPMLHRWTAKAHGRATTIRKRNSHINIILGELKDSGVKGAKKRNVEAPISLAELAKNGEASVRDNKAKEVKEGDKKEASFKGKAESAGKKGFVGKMFNRKSGGN